MKKVGIMTFHCVKNYGGVLQAYALKEAIKTKLSAKVNIINFMPKVITKPYSILNTRNIKFFIKQLIVSPFIAIKYHRYNKFIKKYLDLSKQKYKKEEELKLIDNYFDIYIAGSDQVWNTRIVGKLLDSYFLDFVDKSKIKISYAASIGNNNIEENEIDKYKEQLNNLDAISVREKTAQKVLEKITNKHININSDPVFLLTKEEWNKIAINPNIKEKYILVYCLEENKELNKITQKLSEKTGLPIVDFGITNKYKNEMKAIKTAGPQEFVGLIKNAEYIVTNSFHGTAFSIIYNKEFYTIPHMTRGSRMIDLLTSIGIEDRIVKNIEDFDNLNIDDKINYNQVENNIGNEKVKAMEYLRKYIN